MKKINLLIISLLFAATPLAAQDRVMQVYRNGSVTYEVNTSQVDSVTFLQKNSIMDRLKGEWSWVKSIGGMGGSTSTNEFKSILKILSQNEDGSINYEVIVDDELFSKDSFQLMEDKFGYRTANIKFPHFISSRVNWVIYFGDIWLEKPSKIILSFWDGAIDGYIYYYQKIE